MAVRYYLFSRHRKGHGIHSPFVYKMITEVFLNKSDLSVVSKVEKIRTELLSTGEEIEITDLGAGSLNRRRSKQRVSELTRRSSVSAKYGGLLSRLAMQNNGKPIIELGTSFGISTLYMALSAKSSEVFTIEGCGNRSAIAKSVFQRADAGNIHLMNSDFDMALPEILSRSGTPGMIFIDGNHRRVAVLRYLSIIREHIDKDTLIVLDDIYHSREMGHAWGGIKALKDVTVTIDLFQFGLIFYREGIDKQDFVIRY